MTEVETTTIAAALAAPFAVTHTRPGAGGAVLTYLSGEQVVSRLNAALGVGGWEYAIVAHGVESGESDAVWVHGRLTLYLPERSVALEQFGAADTARVAFGDALKAAGTDALKKCAMLAGVGLYLARQPQSRPATVAPASSRRAASRAERYVA